LRVEGLKSGAWGLGWRGEGGGCTVRVWGGGIRD